VFYFSLTTVSKTLSTYANAHNTHTHRFVVRPGRKCLGKKDIKFVNLDVAKEYDLLVQLIANRKKPVYTMRALCGNNALLHTP
jgi:hypothetical protein